MPEVIPMEGIRPKTYVIERKSILMREENPRSQIEIDCRDSARTRPWGRGLNPGCRGGGHG